MPRPWIFSSAFDSWLEEPLIWLRRCDWDVDDEVNEVSEVILDTLGRIDDVTYMAWCLGVDVGKLGVEAAPGPPAPELLLTCDHPEIVWKIWKIIRVEKKTNDESASLRQASISKIVKPRPAVLLQTWLRNSVLVRDHPYIMSAHLGPFLIHPLCQHKYINECKPKLPYLTHPPSPFADVIYEWSLSWVLSRTFRPNTCRRNRQVFLFSKKRYK